MPFFGNCTLPGILWLWSFLEKKLSGFEKVSRKDRNGGAANAAGYDSKNNAIAIYLFGKNGRGSCESTHCGRCELFALAARKSFYELPGTGVNVNCF